MIHSKESHFTKINEYNVKYNIIQNNNNYMNIGKMIKIIIKYKFKNKLFYNFFNICRIKVPDKVSKGFNKES